MECPSNRTIPSSSKLNRPTQRIQPAESKNKSRKRKQGKNETSNELLEQMITIQMTSDQMMMSLEEKRMKMEERQMELDAQMRQEERQFNCK